MSKPTLIDCNGLAGFMTLGIVEAGTELLSRTGTLDFGNPSTEANRNYLGNKWSSFFSDDPDDWPIQQADIVAGCPPCSGWSVWSSAASRGPDSKAHEHTRAFMKYAARVKPKVIAFECVQQAYTQGRDVMLKYRDMVEDISGKKYDLYHIKQNNLQLGGFSFRPRYFWLAVESGLPFGIQAPTITEFPTVVDVIGDLAKMPESWYAQAYIAPASKFVQHLRSRSGKVDGHIGRNNIDTERVNDIFSLIDNEEWLPSEGIGRALKKAYEKNNNTFPQHWVPIAERALRTDFEFTYSQAYRWSPNYWANVLTGAALTHVVHPTETRLLTHREAARIQGLPDDWSIAGAKDYSALYATWGKAVPVQAARWLGDAIVASLNGQPSGPQGELIGDREYLINTDKGFSRNYVKSFYQVA